MEQGAPLKLTSGVGGEDHPSHPEDTAISAVSGFLSPPALPRCTSGSSSSSGAAARSPGRRTPHLPFSWLAHGGGWGGGRWSAAVEEEDARRRWACRGGEDGILVPGKGRRSDLPMGNICIRGSAEELTLLPVLATCFRRFEGLNEHR